MLSKSRVHNLEALYKVADTLGWYDADYYKNLHLPTNPPRLPKEDEDEYLMFAAYMLAGVNFPLSRFLKTILDFYGIRLADIAPKSVLMLSAFA